MITKLLNHKYFWLMVWDACKMKMVVKIFILFGLVLNAQEQIDVAKVFGQIRGAEMIWSHILNH